jgi:hypothetical protein
MSVGSMKMPREHILNIFCVVNKTTQNEALTMPKLT